MTDNVLIAPAPPRVLPKLSLGPYGLLEAVPWLMFAAAMRFLGYSNAAFALPAFILSSLALFLAFLLAARRMIEFADGSTQLGKFSFNDQLLLARNILRQVAFLLVAGMVVVALAGYPKQAFFMLAGFDGIAFDQFTTLGMLWSAALAAVVLLMVVSAGDGAVASMRTAATELAARWRYLVPAILLVAALQIGLSAGRASCAGSCGNSSSRRRRSRSRTSSISPSSSASRRCGSGSRSPCWYSRCASPIAGRRADLPSPLNRERAFMQVSLQGRSAIVTGGSKGIGFAIGKRFAESGGDVAIVARGREALDAAVAEIKAGTNSHVIGVQADVGNAQDVQRAYDEAMAAFGKLDIAVNNAGTSRAGPFEAMSDKVLARRP